MIDDPRIFEAARIMAGMSQSELAEEAGLRPEKIAELEAGADVFISTLAAVKTALEGRGICFLESDESEGVIRLHKPPYPRK